MASEKRLIDANAFRDFWNKNYRHQYANDNFLVAIANFPTVDAVEVVRCKDCKNWHRFVDTYGACRTGHCFTNDTRMSENDFCSYGERRTDNA